MSKFCPTECYRNVPVVKFANSPADVDFVVEKSKSVFGIANICPASSLPRQWIARHVHHELWHLSDIRPIS